MKEEEEMTDIDTAIAAVKEKREQLLNSARSTMQAADQCAEALVVLEGARYTISTLNGTAGDAPGVPTEAPKKTRRPTGRPKGVRPGDRMDATLAVLKKAGKPLSIPTIAKRMKMQPNYLYRGLPRMEKKGLVVHTEDNLWALTPPVVDDGFGIALGEGRRQT
jgi:hypothetical protein